MKTISLALAAFLLAGPAVAQQADPLSEYRTERYVVPLYRGPLRMPDFNGRDKDHRLFRTRLREGVQEGVKFAGKYAHTAFGCGTHCIINYVIDVSTGQVIPWPRGGDVYVSITKWSPTNTVAQTEWDDGERCYKEKVVLTNGYFQLFDLQPNGSYPACEEAAEDTPATGWSSHSKK